MLLNLGRNDREGQLDIMAIEGTSARNKSTVFDIHEINNREVTW